ncbi:MAG: hypothetical protein JNG90_11585, partial [Planctomycetaceae bacterium]|nr:hypothetical protein [Planctomycetaceae bacterium]
MTRFDKSLLCIAALFMLASSALRASDFDQFTPGEEAEVQPETFDTCGDAPSCRGTPLSVFVPKLTPGFQFSAGLLYLRPGADNLGWATVTTYYPIQNPQWSVESLSPKFQPGFGVGARYVIPDSGKDIQTNWDHLRTGDSQYVAVSDLSTQWISPFSQTGPSTSELVNQTGIFYLKAAAAKVGFDYDQVNLDAGQSVNFGPGTQCRFFAGVSYVRLREQLITTFYNDTSVSPIPPATAIPDPSLRYISL